MYRIKTWPRIGETAMACFEEEKMLFLHVVVEEGADLNSLSVIGELKVTLDEHSTGYHFEPGYSMRWLDENGQDTELSTKIKNLISAYAAGFWRREEVTWLDL